MPLFINQIRFKNKLNMLIVYKSYFRTNLINLTFYKIVYLQKSN